MNLLAGKLYDPGTAVNKVTTGLLAMTALDTTNLRLAFVVPPSGIVRVHMSATVHGATTFPTILLGVLEGSTVRGRQSVKQVLGNTAVATAMLWVEADFLVTGLTPGAALSWDAAYGVETLIAATGLKYGGPNNATANDAFGGFAFEIWDPCPLYTPTSGTAPTSTAHVKIDAIDDFVDTEVAAILAAVDTEVGAIKTKTDQLTFTTANKVDSTIQAAADLAQAAADKVWATTTRALTDKVGFALSTAGILAIWDQLTSALTAAGSIGKLLVDNINATISSRSTYAGGAVASVTGSVGSVATGGLSAASFAAGAIDAVALATDAGTELADALLDRNMATGTDSGSPTVRTVRQALRMLRNKAAIAAGTLTVRKEDDTTASWTATVTTAAGDPISEIDPA